MDECKTTPPSTGVNGSAISPVSIDLDDKEGQDHPDADGAGRTRNPMVSFLVIASNHRAVEFALLSVVIVVVWGMLCLPVVFYHVTDSGSDSAEQQPAFEVVSGNETTFEVGSISRSGHIHRLQFFSRNGSISLVSGEMV